jgi:anti-anti-sigma factor
VPATALASSDLDRALAVAVDWSTGSVVVRGELDRDAAHHLLDALGSLLSTHHLRWTIDTAGVTWCDAGGLRTLAAAHALAVAHGRELRLTPSSRCVDRLVSLSGLDRLIAASMTA